MRPRQIRNRRLLGPGLLVIAPALFAGTALAILPSAALAQNTSDTRMLADPAISADHIAFVYDSDLWVADRDGSNPRRLTTHPGAELSPRFSPDGRWIAFSSQYDGNLDVFVVAAEGGAPRRLTWHPAPDIVRDWDASGESILFTSGRDTYFGGFNKLMSVSVTTGALEDEGIPTAFSAAVSADNARIAYSPIAPAMGQWKNYRGGRYSRIWLYDRSSQDVAEVPQPDGYSNDLAPMWVGGRIYFLSDRAGEFNLFSYDEADGSIEQHTDYDTFPIQAASSGGGAIIYEQAGYLHVFDPASDQSSRLRIGIATDLRATRPRWESGAQYLRNADLSPSGARAVFEYRGDIVTVPAEHGDPRLLTETSGVHERSPVWSPDGSKIAYFSDASGEYRLHVVRQDGSGEPQVFEVDGAGYYEDPEWSPDGTMIAYTDNAWALWILNVETGRTTEVAREAQYGPSKTIGHDWSPDSKWIAYTLNTPVYMQQVFVYSLESGESTAITDGLSDVAEPTFDQSGKYLYFFASTNAGPVRQWFAMSNADMEYQGTLYLAVLSADDESPLKPQSDEEAGGTEEAEAAEAAAAAGGGEGREEAEEGGEVEEDEGVRIDFEGIDQRIVQLPVGTGWMGGLSRGNAGQLYYLRADRAAGGPIGPVSLKRFTLSGREEQNLADGVSGYELSGDHSKLLVRIGQDGYIVGAGPVDRSQGRIALQDIRVHIDPREEWAQMLREAWRIQRDYFYDPDMHGADWDAVWDRYQQFLPDLATRNDLNRVLTWMMSELSVGHSRQTAPGDLFLSSESVGGGLLGADFEVANGRYRFAKVLGGLNWTPGLRAPLTEPGVNVEAGDYLIAVEGEDITASDNLYAPFENTAGNQVRITVASDAQGSDARTVTVVPISNDTQLRLRDWVEGNIQKVHDATGGRVAYVWVPNTTGLGWEYFKRYFFPQAHLDAIIVDERFNGGGQLADYVIDILDRHHIASWATRYGNDIPTPIAAIDGPKVMLIDEYAGSGGDFLPWMFRQFELGPLIGRRTWGGLVGILQTPVLIDGGGVTSPNIGFWTEDEGFGIENIGVPPDIEVEQLPAQMRDGGDPQLERAIEEILRMLDANPPDRWTRPGFPVRARRGGG